MTIARTTNFSRIKEAATAWDRIQQLLRSGDKGYLVPVVIPRDRRGFGWLGMLAFAFYVVGVALAIETAILRVAVFAVGVILVLLALVWFWRQAVVSIEQGTTGILSRYGEIVGTLGPGRHFLWWPWLKVDSIVDTSTEFPYTAPVLASPTRENIPLKSIEFFLKFRIVDPVRFVRNIGASNFDAVLSSVVQDAIRRRSRQVETERAYDLRSSDVGDMPSTSCGTCAGSWRSNGPRRSAMLAWSRHVRRSTRHAKILRRCFRNKSYRLKRYAGTLRRAVERRSTPLRTRPKPSNTWAIPIATTALSGNTS